MTKPWYQSKTKWAGIILGLAQLAKLFPPALPFVPVAEALAAALGAFGVRDAIASGPN